MAVSLEGDRQIAQAIHPTGQCFDDALELLLYLHAEEHVPAADLRVVHAICLLPDETCTGAPSRGTRFAHAWVERQGQCLFLGLYQGARMLCSVERAAYYAHLRVQERTKYTPWQAARENRRTHSYGPWKPRYLAYTRQKDAADA